eukprot:195328_1
MSSICSKASIQTKTSHTYCVGDLNNNNNGDTIPGIDDNWENLNTMAKHGVVDPSEYLKQARLIVKAVTGTTIKLTRKGSGDDNVYKSGFFEFEDNIPDWNKISTQSAIKYEWNIDKLGWDKSYIIVKIAENPFSRGSLRVSYYCLHLNESNNPFISDINTLKGYHSKSFNGNEKQNKKIHQSMSVPADVALHSPNNNNNTSSNQLLSPYFSAASLPEAEDEKLEISDCKEPDNIELEIEDDNEEKSTSNLLLNNNNSNSNDSKSIQSKNSPTFTGTISTKTNLQTQKGDLVSRLLGFENKYGGTLIVAKQSIDLTESVQTYFNDVRTQSVSQLFANEYNKYNPPKKVAFIKASVIQLLESDSEQFFCVEDYLHGAYMKHLDNYGGDEGIRNTPSAFAHFTYEASQHRLLVCDIQGVGDLYTDPQIHTFNGKGFGKGNLGIDGMIKFLKTHQCNAICQHLKLDIVNPKPMVYGTRPAKMYMDSKKITVIDRLDHLSTEEYHKIPKIPISTLNDYYLQQIYKMDRHSTHNKHKPNKQSICEKNNNACDNGLEDIMSDDPNTVNTRYSCHQSTSNINNDSSDNDYNPLTPLINHIDDTEDTKCGICNCIVL